MQLRDVAIGAIDVEVDELPDVLVVRDGHGAGLRDKEREDGGTVVNGRAGTMRH